MEIKAKIFYKDKKIMGNIIFVWFPVALTALSLLLVLVAPERAFPYQAMIFLLTVSVSGYTGMKSIGLTKTANKMPTGEGIPPESKKKLKRILWSLYAILGEALIILYIVPEAEFPLEDLIFSIAVCSGVVLAGGESMKTAEKAEGEGEKIQ